jgi:WD40 repeat protein
MRFRTLSIVVFSLLIAGNYLVACQTATSIPEPTPTTPPVPTATPIVESVVTHPELEVVAPSNISRLEQIDQWGQGNVNGIALSPDGNLIAVSTTTGIYLYDRRTVKQVDYIDVRVGENNDVETQACPTAGNLAFSPDGSTLAIASKDITLWDLKTNTVHAVIKNKIEDTDSTITEIQFSNDGNSIIGIQKRASGYPCYSGWGSLVIYTIETGKIVFRHDYSRYEEGPNPILLEKDGIVFIAYYESQKGYSVLEVNSQTGKIVAKKQSPTIYSINNKAAVTYKWISNGDGGDGYSETHIVDLTSFKDIEVLNASVELIPQSDKMIVREKQKLTVRTLEGVATCSKPIDTESANSFLPEIFSSDGSIAISWNYYGNRAGDVRIWDLKQCTISVPVLIFPEVAREMSFSSDGRSILTGSSAGYTFHVFDVQTGQMRFSLSGFDAGFSANGKQVFVVEEASVNAYDVETGEYSYSVLKTDSDYMTDIVVSPDGQFVALTNDPYRDYHFFRVGDNSVLNKIPDAIDGYPYFSQDRKYMAVIKSKTAASSEIRFWDISTGNELTQWQGMVPNEGYVNASFNSDFTQLATFGTDGYYKYVYIWNVPEFSLAKTLTQAFPNSDRSINNLEFISNNQLLFAFGSNPDVFIFWSASTGDLLSEIPAEVNRSELGNPILFSPDGRLLAVLDDDGTIHVWGVKSP